MWGAGIAAGTALIAYWSVVGPGYLWLSGGVVAGVGALTSFAGGGTLAWVSTVFAIVGIVVARRPRIAAAVFAAAAAVSLGVAMGDSPPLPARSGTVLLGSITSEMMLGHWYLVDPRLPRRPLHTLAVIAGAGLIVDVGYVASTGSITISGTEGVFGMAYVMLGGFTGLLIAGVWFSLKERRYSGVMAATGLSYLAVLTTFGVITLGRVLVVGGI